MAQSVSTVTSIGQMFKKQCRQPLAGNNAISERLEVLHNTALYKFTFTIYFTNMPSCP